jgi:hypothetical protein
MYYVVVDIGCLECGESSMVIGIFTEIEKAKKAKLNHKSKAHNVVEIYPIPELDKIVNIEEEI